MASTKIDWADKAWNPVTGCAPISEGCAHCYAQRMAKRLAGRYGYPEDEPFRVMIHQDKLYEPKKWKAPQRIFLCSMGDPFHVDVPRWWIDTIFEESYRWPQHTLMVLTKRPDSMYQYFDSTSNRVEYLLKNKNIWLGVTCESNDYLWRIEELLKIPAAVHFVSLEPMLGAVDLRPYLPGCWECSGSCGYRQADHPDEQRCYECGHEQTEEWGVDDQGQDKCPECGALASIEYPCPQCYDYGMVHYHPDTPCLSWVVCGGETGPGARPMHPDHVRKVRDDCHAAGVPFFFKQWGMYRELVDGEKLQDGDVQITPEGNYLTCGSDWKGTVWCNPPSGTASMKKTTKKAAGHLLDGREWREIPAGAKWRQEGRKEGV